MATDLTTIDLSTYTRIGRYDLPEPTRTAAPTNSLLAQEVSAVTYDWDTDTLFVLGDGGTSIVQVTKTGELINSMTLARGSSPQGTEFYDPEGLTYVGGGKFVLVEERDRQAVSFTYTPGTTLIRAATQTVKLGTTIGNIGLEGISYDPQTGGFIAVKEKDPEGIFQTGINFAAGTATNGSPTTENSTNLFDPTKANLLDFADVYALSNLSTLTGSDTSHLLVLSQESGKIVNIDRAGNVFSSLTIVSDPGNPLSVVDQQHEGLTVDNNGFLYVVSENGGGDIDHPQLWVYAPSQTPIANQAPTAVSFNNSILSIAQTTSTTTPVKVADIAITDDGKGTNNLTVAGADASFFEISGAGLFLKAGTTLNAATKSSYSVTVNVDDPTVGTTPDASRAFTLGVTIAPLIVPSLIISEASPWSSGNSPYAADWFEVTNTGTSAVNLTGWKIDDNSNSFGSAVALNGVTSIAAGQSVVFIESSTPDVTIAQFKSTWFGSNVPSGLTIGTYTGAGVGLSTGGDAVNLFDASGNLVTGISFGTSTTGFTFDNKAGLSSTTLPLPTVSTLSVSGVNGAFVSASGTETGSPGAILPKLIISEASPWSSGNSPYAADWFEVTNIGTAAVNLTGWKMDDNSNSFGSAVALRGVTSIAAGKSVIFIEGAADGSTDAALISSFSSFWFGSVNPPADVAIGTYGGAGVGLSTGGDAVNLFDASGSRVTGISFGVSTTGFTFDNSAGLSSTTLPLPTVSTLSVNGVKGAFVSPAGAEVGSPGAIANLLGSVIRGGLGNDTLYGGSGDDYFLLGDGNNTAYGNGGNDRFVAGNGNDTVYGGSGNDTFLLGDGNNIAYGNGGNDTFSTGSGIDQIYGSFGNDTINAGGGNDTIFGNGGNDTIFGGTGDDVIYTGAGVNFIDGGSGNDTIWLGGGRDKVVLRRSDGVDTINGFKPGETQLSLSGGLRFSDVTFTQGNGFTSLSVGADLLARVNGIQAGFLNNTSNFSLLG